MKIDIISYTDAQFAALTEEQLLEVKSAQLKKNRLKAALTENLQKEKYRLMNNGILISTIWDIVQWQLNKAYEDEVEALRDALLFYLRFSGKPNEEDIQSAPYEVDYSLSDTERFQVVKTYYESAYTDSAERFDAFKADTVAAQYLGELYAPLYDFFLEQV